jgi:hypothetical protein
MALLQCPLNAPAGCGRAGQTMVAHRESILSQCGADMCSGLGAEASPCAQHVQPVQVATHLHTHTQPERSVQSGLGLGHYMTM